MLSSNVGKRSPTISESTVTNAENVMSNLLVNNDKNVGHTNLRGEESHRFLQVKKNSFIGAKNLFSGFLKKMFQKRKKGRYPSPSGKSCYRCDLTANTLNYVPEHHCLDPSYCGCDEMAGSDCEMAKRGCCNSFCDPLCLEDMIGCTISGSAERLNGQGGDALKDELCHLLVGAGCSNELPACNGKHVFVHFADSSNPLGMIKRVQHTSAIKSLAGDEGCSVSVKFSIKKENPYPCTNGKKPNPKLDDAPNHPKPFDYIGHPYLGELPAMPSMCARWEQLKIKFLAAKGALEAQATKRAMSCLGCSNDGGNECSFKSMFGVEYFDL
eukprot:g9055.t1